VPKSSHPPITAMASPANTRIRALTGRRGGPVDTFSREIAGTAAGVCLAV